jgi:hypothetical protein
MAHATLSENQNSQRANVFHPRGVSGLPKTLLTKRHKPRLNGDLHMVYCPKCGTQNEDTAEFCVKCGANLQTGTYTSRRYERRKAEKECFGLPHGGAIAGLVIGVIILLWGIFTLAQQMNWVTQTPSLWFIVIIIFGILLIIGAVYGMTRTKPTQ